MRFPRWVKVGAVLLECLFLLGWMQNVYDTRHPKAAVISAECRDHSVSHSKHRSGTCSHHGGVLRWIAHE